MVGGGRGLSGGWFGTFGQSVDTILCNAVPASRWSRGAVTPTEGACVVPQIWKEPLFSSPKRLSDFPSWML